MAGRQITLADVQVSSISLFKNEGDKWMLRAHYQVLDDGGKTRGADVIEFEPAASRQTQIQALADVLTAQVKIKEGLDERG